MKAMKMNRLKEVRINAKKEQKEVANFLGVTPTALSYYENGKRKPKPETWHKLADFYGVSVPYLKGYMVCTRCKGYFIPMDDVSRNEIKGCPYCGNPYFEGDKRWMHNNF